MSTTPNLYAELELGLRRVMTDSYQVDLRFTHPDSQAEVAPVSGPAALDLEELLALQQDPRAYGEALAAQVFADEKARLLCCRTRTAVEATGRFLRLRLLVGPTAPPELHNLRWELLTDPETKEPLATSEKILFSRFLVSQDWRPVKLRPKFKLTAVVAVAAPADLGRYQWLIMTLEGCADLKQYSRVGVQVDPEEHSLADVERARKYLGLLRHRPQRRTRARRAAHRHLLGHRRRFPEGAA